MIQEILDRCEARPIGTTSPYWESSLDSIGRYFQLTEIHRKVISFYEGARISFGLSTKVNLDWINSEDSSDVLLVGELFGVGGGEGSIEQMYRSRSHLIPSHLLPFASSPMDDLYCIDSNGVVFYWNHENPQRSLAYPLAGSFDIFFNALEPWVYDQDSPSGAIDSESWIDPDL